MLIYSQSFMICSHPPEKIEDLLLIHNIKLDDNTFGDVSEIILDFIFLLQTI